MQILQPPGWPKPKGYSNGIMAEGKVIFIAGQVGWDKNETITSDDFASQVRQALANIVAILAEAGAGANHITRMTWYTTDVNAYQDALKKVGEIYREIIGNHYPAMTLVEVSALLEEGAKVEIEATAVIPDGR